MFNPLTDYVDDENAKQKASDPFGRLPQASHCHPREGGDPEEVNVSCL